ncbi:hypothetical protein CSC2_48060 [Clostridium zeae]|uniref:AAA family ATPase n=1 Tax=Clostridium zeae TaxID=2759022 RepID=A0ABQ1EHP7_9CLOT|nr:ATP-binding protein [Clostridium zeae]GFZ34280.1 hypothetical protein CSC2_48060 [Clostridium zeae]
MQNNIVFISGIHGVGKTTLCNNISSEFNIPYYTASKLISDVKKIPFTSLFIDGIDTNQDLLVSAANKLIDRNKTCILDGHFCLLNKNEEPEKIPQKTFELLGLKSIIVLTEDVNTIWYRLKERNNCEYDINLLKELQEMELAYSHEISAFLNIPYIVLDLSNSDNESLLSKINDLLSV